MAKESFLQRKNVPPSDAAGHGKTIYDVSGFQVFSRNVIAGMGRAVGGTIVYLVGLFVLAYLFNRYVLPVVSPLIETLQDSMDTLQILTPKGESITPTVNQDQLQQIINQVKR